MIEKSYEALGKMTEENIYTDNFLKPELRGFIVHYILDRQEGTVGSDLDENVDDFITNLNIRFN